MKVRQVQIRRTVNLLGCAVLCAASVGCKKDEIRSYAAPAPQQVETKPRADGPSPQRASLPGGGAAPRPSIDYRAPDGWQPDSDPSGMSVAAFGISAGDERARMTVTPLAGAAGGLVQNVNRWRGQIGLPPVEPDGLGEIVRNIEVAGVEAQYVDLVGPDAPGGAQRILGVVAVAGSTTWFFKMTGSAELVGKQKEAFESFVRSVRFDGKEHE
jgi:hypothetical protein